MGRLGPFFLTMRHGAGGITHLCITDYQMPAEVCGVAARAPIPGGGRKQKGKQGSGFV